MTQNKNLALLNVALVIFIIVSIVYGISYMLFPKTLVDISGSSPIAPFPWLRWSGGMLIAMGIGAIMIIRNPAKQKIFVTTLVLANLLIGLALLYSLFFEVNGHVWFTAVPAIITLVMAVLLYWGLKQAKETLE